MISIEQKLKFVLYGFAFFFALWFVSVIFEHGDADELSAFIKNACMGLWTAACLMFDIKQFNERGSVSPPPTDSTNKE